MQILAWRRHLAPFISSALVTFSRDASDIDLSLETDPAVLPGGCVVSAGDGEIDARLDAQMGRIVRGLFPELVDDVEDAPVAEGPAEAGEGDGPSGEVPG